MPEFRSPQQIAHEAKGTEPSQSGPENLDGITDANIPNEENWRRCTNAELRAWAGFEVPEGIQEEKGVAYEFQLWERISLGDIIRPHGEILQLTMLLFLTDNGSYVT